MELTTGRSSLSLAVLAMAFIACLVTTSARAQTMLEVINSTVGTIAVGTKVPETHEFDVPKDKQVQLLKTPNATTHIIQGAYKGTLEAYEKSQKRTWYERLFSGSRKPAPPVGGTRGLR